MSEFLNEIRPTAQILVELFYEMLKVHITIVDDQMRRIANSKSQKKFNRESAAGEDATPTGGILFETIHQGKIHIVGDPKVNEACAKCTHKENCHEMYHMSSPIMVDGKVAGALGFIATSTRQKTRMIKEQKRYLLFLQQFSELIAMKIREANDKTDRLLDIELLNAIINHSNEGVLVFDSENQLIRMNAVAQRAFVIKDILPVAAELSVLNQYTDYSEYLFQIGNKSYRLSGKMHPINLEGYSSILLFLNALRTEPDRTERQTETGIRRIQGNSQAIQGVKKQILLFANSSSPVLISGEYGVGKAMTARAIHEESGREGLYIEVNCHTDNIEKLEADIFGSVALTSKRGEKGAVENATGGTLVFTDIDDLPFTLQEKLCKFLEEGNFTRVGGSRARRTHLRIMATTKKDLKKLVTDGRFSEDLYYRLQVLVLNIPPLRSRTEDICPAAKKILGKEAKKAGKTVSGIAPEFWKNLFSYSWPGNFPELRSTMEYVINNMDIDGKITEKQLPEFREETVTETESNENIKLKDLEKKAVRAAVARYGTDAESRKRAADDLGIGIATLYRKMHEYNI